ncbi:MAG TPA: hypothetical protein VF656_13055 [Pyrinomonadaceae bacterium]|jgi:hypothetical protein
MLRKTLAFLLAGIILQAAFGFQPIQAQTHEDARLTEQARARVLKAGTGERARVEVKLRDASKFKGYVSAAGADSFTITDAKTGASRVVAYEDVAQVKRRGNGLSTMTKVLIGGAVAAGAIIGWQVVKPAVCDGGAQTRGIC